MFGPIQNNITLEQVAGLRQSIADLYVIEDMTIGSPHPGYVRFRGQFMRDAGESFIEVRRRFQPQGFTPLLRQQDGEPVLIAMSIVFDPPPSNPRINLLLLIVTIISTLYVGAASDPAFTGQNLLREIWLGLPFSLSIMLILGAHELGHYFAARHHGVAVTLPYFIPMPFSLIGTLGAFIQLKAPVTNRRALLDIGAAGPLAGMVFALPLLIIGLKMSSVGPIDAGGGYVLEGNSLLYAFLKIVLFGRMLPDGAVDVSLNQVAWAGWVGLLVTGLNLLPVAQLDGGHIAYVLSGKWAKRLYWPVLIGLLVLGALVTQNVLQWGFWVLLLLLLGNRHAEPLDDVTPLDPRRRAVAIFSLLLFVLVFVPVPITFVPPG